MKEFNVNDYVKVKLNDLGYKILEDFYDDLLKSANNRRTVLPENFFDVNKYPELDEEGYVTYQLWKLMEIFGQHMHAGEKVPFESYILLSESDLSNQIGRASCRESV